MNTPKLLLLIPALIVSGCEVGSPNATPVTSATAPPAPSSPPATPSPTPCIGATCATKTEHLFIFDAENSAFSNTGRLFISGGTDVLEITKDSSGNLQSSVVSNQTCNYTGLTVKGSTLYAACGGDNRIYAADIDALPLMPIYTVTGAQLINGLVHLDDFLYVTNGPLAPTQSKIIQLQLDTGNAFNILSQSDWTTPLELQSANGLQVVNNEIWVTDFNQLKRYEVDSAGAKGATSVVLTQGAAAFDDFTVLDNGDIVMAEVNNMVYRYDSAGTLLETATNVMGPSSAIQGQAPMFNTWDIIVTEKGTLGDNTPGTGNRLAVFTAN